jgi:hypothetical protein
LTWEQVIAVCVVFSSAAAYELKVCRLWSSALGCRDRHFRQRLFRCFCKRLLSKFNQRFIIIENAVVIIGGECFTARSTFFSPVSDIYFLSLFLLFFATLELIRGEQFTVLHC